MSGAGSLERARALLAGALDIDVADIADDTSIMTEERWDSLAHVRVITALGAALGQPVGPEVIVTIASVGDIADQLGEG